MKFLSIMIGLFCALSCPLLSATKKNSQSFSQEVHQQIDDLSHQLHILTSERDILDETVRSQGSALNELKQKINAKAEGFKEKAPATERRLEALEKHQTTFLEDLKRIKNHVNELTATLAEYQKDLSQIKAEFEGNLSHLKRAVDTLIKTLQKETTQEAAATTGKAYKVKSGDSLERIAKSHGTTVQEIKRLNHLKHDKIIAGQELILE